MILSVYRGKVVFVVIVGMLVTVSLVSAAAFYFLGNRAEEQALKQETSRQQAGVPTTFGEPLAGSGVFNPDMADVAKVDKAEVSEDGRESDNTGYHFESPEYLVPENQDSSDTTTVTEDTTTSGDVSSIGPDRSTVSRLRVEGDKVFYPSGKEALLRGFSWGTWGTSRFHDGDRNVTEGANTVRIVLRWWGKYYDDSVDSRDDDAPGHIDAEHLAELDRMVKYASESGLWIDLAIDSDCGQNGLQQDVVGTQAYCDPDNKYGSAGHNFWTDRDTRTKFFEVWKFVADRYKNTPYVGMYELLPEPNPITYNADDISEFYQGLIDVVHGADSRTPILIGSRVYMIKLVESSYIDTEEKIPLIYTGNLFAHPELGAYEDVMYDLQYRLKHLTDFRAKHNVPVFVQQTGVRSVDDPGEIYTDAVLALLNKNSVGWDWWEYRQQGPYAGGYGLWYMRNDGTWVKKDAVSKVISNRLKEKE